ncbi:MAG: hypothetical protein ACRDOO_16015 [Actinomadura sp.]
MASSPNHPSEVRPAWASRLLLGICAAAAIIGGALLVVQVVVYFAASEYVPELEVGGYGTLVGAVGLAIYAGGAFRAHVAARVAAGIGLAFSGYAASVVIAGIVSLTADRGGPRGNLEDGTLGAIWLLAGVFFAWCAATGNWPVKQAHGTHTRTL